MMREPGEISGLRGEKDGKIPWALMQESMRWPLAMVLWQLVREPIEYGFGMSGEGGESSMRFLKI